MKKTILSLSMFLIALFLFAQPPGRNERGHTGAKHNKAEKMIELLDLNEQQRDQIEEWSLAHRSEMQEVRKYMDVKEAELNLAVTTEPLDKNVVDQLIADLNELRNQQFQAQVDHRIQIRSILSAEQKVKFDDMHYQVRKRGRGGRGH
jgi:Spy/CpxP family protein refolding chaperone